MKLVRKNIMKLLLGVLFLIAGLLYSCGFKAEPEEALLSLYEEIPEAANQINSEAETAETTAAMQMIYVHVCGAVHEPNVYEVPAGTRGYELIKLAGGFTEDAADDYLNLAKEALDGDKLLVPKKGEVTISLAEQGNDGQQQLININTASENELMTLPGIGAAKAKAIIKYRESQGGFAAIEDIMKISGIKEAAFEKIKDFIIT